MRADRGCFKSMHIHAYGLTDKGQVRSENQDAYFIDLEHQVYAVADGLGGLPGGADASRRVTELLRQSMDGIKAQEERFDLAELIISINHIIAKESMDAYPDTGSGSTLTLCQIVEGQLLIGHVGDSAAYLWRGGELEKLTIDHTMEQELIDEHGEAARQHMPPEYPHTLTRCIGQENEFRVDQTRIELEAGDRVLLCTDGLNKVVSEAEIAQVLGSGKNAQELTIQLANRANEESGPDNITIITLLLS